MKKRLITSALMVLFAGAILFFLFKDEPPVGERIVTDPARYLQTSRYVATRREAALADGRLTRSFLPDLQDGAEMREYLYWYKCALLGDPNYAVAVTVYYADEGAFEAEIRRLCALEDFGWTASEGTLIVEKGTAPKIRAYLEPPLHDGCEYLLEYAIVSLKERTITYTEANLWEGQVCHETIRGQLELLKIVLP